MVMARRRRPATRPRRLRGGMSKRKRKKDEGPSVNAGRTFADKDRPRRWYVVLKVDFAWSLVWWEKGRVRTIPLSHMKQRKIRITAFDFPMSQLLDAWGVTTRQIDQYLEQHMYRWDDDVQHVRATRRPLTGRTIDVVRPSHRHHGVGGS